MAKTNKKLSDSVQSLPNIGKVSAQKLAKIGIKTRQDFLKRNPYEIFNELLKDIDPTLCRCALAGLVGAALNKPWNEVTKVAAKEYEKLYPQHTWGKKKC